MFGAKLSALPWDQDYQDSDYRGPDYWDSDYRGPGYRDSDYWDSDYRGPGYQDSDYRGPGYQDSDYRGPDYRDSDYWDSDYRGPGYQDSDYRCPDFHGTSVIRIHFTIHHQRQIMKTPNKIGNVSIRKLQAHSDLCILHSPQMVTLYDALLSQLL